MVSDWFYDFIVYRFEYDTRRVKVETIDEIISYDMYIHLKCEFTFFESINQS